MLLDNKTLLFCLMLMSGMMALSLSLVSRQGPRQGLSSWAGALALESLVWMLVAARGTIPDFYSILVANVLIVTAQAMKLAAIHEYRKLEFPRIRCLLPILLAVVVFAWLPYENAAHRLALNSTILAVQFLLMLQALWDDDGSRSGNAWRMLFGATLLMIPLLAMRAIVSLTGTAEFATPHSAIAPNPVQLMVFIGVIALSLLGSMGFILMIKERGDREIRMLAMTDSLTHVLNRRAFMEQAAKHISGAQRQHQPLALLMIDIDHFKRINDEYGHPAGDTVLVRITELLSAQLRGQDVIGRYGGEEFCVLLPATNEAGALALAEKLRREVESMRIEIGKHTLSVTISLGVAAVRNLVDEKRHCDLASMLQDADRALYLAKSKGRNRALPLNLGPETQAAAG
jgi:diguanylate cyclase (GGDEF)-like protein